MTRAQDTSQAQKQFPSIAAARAHIDAIDMQLQTLMNGRANCARAIAALKQQSDTQPAHFYRPEREAALLRAVAERNTGPLPDTAIQHIFREIMSHCLALEQPISVAFLGPAGTFTQEATIKHFGSAAITVPKDSLDAVFRAVETKETQFGVVPVENSSEGTVNHTLDILQQSQLHICGEVLLPIKQHLLRAPNATGAITAIVSHDQSLAQCRRWLIQHYPDVRKEAVASNAVAAQAAQRDSTVAAVGPLSGATLYNLDIVASGIEDCSDNQTRFLVIGDYAPAPSGHDVTALLLATGNRPGALYAMLKPFSDCAVDMFRIESRPARIGGWQYVFFIDVLGHQEDDAVIKALHLVRNSGAFVRVLGSYPKYIQRESA